MQLKTLLQYEILLFQTVWKSLKQLFRSLRHIGTLHFMHIQRDFPPHDFFEGPYNDICWHFCCYSEQEDARRNRVGMVLVRVEFLEYLH